MHPPIRPPLRNSFSRAGFPRPCRMAFSLVEVALALGIVSFGLVALLGVVPVAMDRYREAMDANVAADVMRTLVGELEGAYGENQTPNLNPRYFTMEGIETTDPGAGLYEARFEERSNGDVDIFGTPLDELKAVKVRMFRLPAGACKWGGAHAGLHYFRCFMTDRPAGCRAQRGRGNGGVTLVELLISITILALLLVLMMQIVGSLSSTWTRMSGKVEAFAAARAGFDAMTRSVQQATLKSFYAYANAAGEPVPLINPSARIAGLDRSKIPTRYLRASDLHFLVKKTSDLMTSAGAAASADATPGFSIFFQAPLGRGADPEVETRTTLLNSLGYFVEYGDTAALKPGAISTSEIRPRYRLMELVQSAGRNAIYESTLEKNASTGLPDYKYDLNWVRKMVSGSSSGTKYVLAENIVFLSFLAKLSDYNPGQGTLSPNYAYDSRWWEAGYTGKSPRDERIRSQLHRLCSRW